MTNYPASIQSIPNPTSTDLLENATPELDHDYQHSTANDTIEALEAKVGVDGSAVTTSHDYKLGEVTGSDKAVGKTATQTLTNKTLTSPQINFGSDARGDIPYRNGSGVTTRLPIGSSGQILSANASGDPEWIANPSASDASYTVKGVVKGDTDAATSGLTIASGVISVNSGTTANKILKLDSSAKIPAVDGSQLTNLPTRIGANYAVNADESLGTYFTYTPILSASSANGWVATNVASGSVGIGNQYATWQTNTTGLGFAGVSSGTIPGALGQSQWRTNEGKVIRMKFRMKFSSLAASNFSGFGFGVSDLLISASTDTNNGLKFINDAGTLYAQNADNTTATRTNISSGITLTNWNLYEFVFTPGTDIKFYLNGTLVATHTTNLPSALTPGIFIGTSGTNVNTVEIAGLIISQQL